MKCHPKCDVALPSIGNARIHTSFDTCRSPMELIIRTIHEVKSTSVFTIGNDHTVSRSIGTSPWPLNLNVQFKESGPHHVYVKACIYTIQEDMETCFMNTTFQKANFDNCEQLKSVSSSIPVFVLSVFLALLAFSMCVGMIIACHKAISRFCSHSPSGNYHKQSQCTALITSMHQQKMSMEEDRLTVIEEEKEETSHLSPSSSFDGLQNSRGVSFNGSTSHRSTLSIPILCSPKPPPYPV